MIALYGQTLLASQYWCDGCHTGFDRVRWRPAGERRDGRAVGEVRPSDE